MEKDLDGEYGIPYQVATWATRIAYPADSEQFMLIEDLYKQVRTVTKKSRDESMSFK